MIGTYWHRLRLLFVTYLAPPAGRVMALIATYLGPPARRLGALLTANLGPPARRLEGLFAAYFGRLAALFERRFPRQTVQLKALLASRSRISVQLYLGIGGAVAITMAASFVGWFSFNEVRDEQTRVNEESVPEVVAAFGVAQHGSTLAAAAPSLTVATTPEELESAVQHIEQARVALEEQLDVLGLLLTDDEVYLRIRNQAEALILSIDAIKSEMSDLFMILTLKEALRTELEELSTQLETIVIPAVDDQLFFTTTGYFRLGESPVGREIHFSETQFGFYRHLLSLQTEANIVTEILAIASTVTNPALVEPLRERVESAEARVERSLLALEGFPLRGQIDSNFARLIELGKGEQGALDLLVAELRLAQRQSDLLEQNRKVAADLVADADALVGAASASVQESTLASSQAVATGRTLLVAISAVSVAAAVLIAWLYVGRVLLHRLGILSERMRGMARGDLEAKVEMSGKDEVADMAAALEVFRRHALEVQRLNLVEEMAEELLNKNEQLESVLDELRIAQDQIVMREKLAALGELTAGVAHEIRNPLNFVKNFSEVSGELLTELQEIIEEGDGTLNEDKRGLIQEISGDLNGNLERIRQHGDRANRIVQDMLMMGRGSSELHMTDINNLFDEYVRLAYHSARATDPNFQLHIEQDFDPEAGSLEVIPQDLGRVFLNVVSNACDATDDKRRRALEAGQEGEPYTPTILISSRRSEESIELRVRDNGDGIPPDVIENIFNPFFTTKPTGKGTGLGLAMSNDIAREHGGSISVESEPGQFTEMIIELPLVPAIRAVEEGSEASVSS